MTKNKILSCSRRTIAFILVFLVTVTSSSYAAPFAWAKRGGKTFSCYSITFEADLYGSNAITGIAEAMDWNLQSDILDEWTGLDGKTHYRESGDEYEYYLEFSGTSDGYTANDQEGYKGTFEYLLDDPPPRYEDGNLGQEMVGTGLNFPLTNGSGKLFDWLKQNNPNWNFVNNTNGTGVDFTDGWWYDPDTGEGYDTSGMDIGTVIWGAYGDGGILMPAANADTSPEEITSYIKSKYPEWNDAMIAGLLGNCVGESGFCTFAYGTDTDGSPSFGLFQFHLNRIDSLKDWCGKNGYDYNTMEGQVSYLLEAELMPGGEHVNAGWDDWSATTCWQEFSSIPDTYDGAVYATEYFRAHCERGGYAQKDSRQRTGASYYDTMKGNQ